MSKFNDEYEKYNSKVQDLVGTLLKWGFLSIIIGIGVGLISAVFSYLIALATDFRVAHNWVVFGLPIGGLIIVAMYRLSGQAKNAGTNMVMQVVRDDEELMPGKIAPLILVASVITHFFGGSAGREGAALQFGASVGDWFGRRIHLSESDRKIITLASMSAAFSGLLGTPMAAALFPMEVISVGIFYYAALVPCVFSSFIAQEVCFLLNVRTLTPPYAVSAVPSFYSWDTVKIILMALAFAVAGVLFCTALHTAEGLYAKYIKNQYIRIVVGACLVIALYFAVGTDAYLGLGDTIIKDSFTTPAGFEMFLLKIVFTALTLCAGFKGGEIVPTLFIGATLGSAMSVITGMPVALCAACGMVGVFCAVTNSPITSFILAFELFGGAGMKFYCIVIAICYLMSGYTSLYKEQRIAYSKTENKYINKKLK
ncbi:MAG: chloride channel protein [Clostridiales bacterium]|nr:chloride channel protein [Candidatus Crickella equi]